MYAHIHTLVVRMEIDIHIPRTSKCCNVLDVVRICEIPDSQAQSVFDAFIMSATTPPERHNPKAWANYGCKGSDFL
ncbi:MAG: hypothetical protein IKY67_08055 [Paludibacteraceae bacterium]|nr:hypothetical protein [Paludibacteraceae bacterium]